MTVWRGEVNFNSVSLSIPAATAAVQGSDAGAGYGFACADGISQLYVVHAIIADVELNFPYVPTYHSRAVAGLLSTMPGPSPNVFPLARGFWLGDHVIADVLDNGLAFDAGGQFAIEKDTSTGNVSFITPMGTWVTTAGALGISPTTELRPLSIGLVLRAQHFVPTSPTQSLDIQAQNFYGKENGSIISGAALSAADPGQWSPWAESDDFDRRFTATFTQLVAAEEANLTYPGQPEVSADFAEDAWYRAFTGADMMSSPLPLDTCVIPEHAAIAGVWLMMPGHISFRHSHDGGSTWIDRMISGPTAADSPTVQWFAGAAFVCYYESGTIYTRKSVDFGSSWSAVLSVTISGTNPRLVIAPDGTFFYFYISGGTLLLQRSADGGSTLLDATPIPVATSVTAQEFGAVLGADRALSVSYIATGSWITRRSVDWGNFWFTV